MIPIRHVMPFAFVALLPLGGWLGGAWTFLPAAATPTLLAILDLALGDGPPQDLTPRATGERWLPRFYVLVQLAATAWAAAWVARPSTGLREAAGLTVSVGVLTGVFGFVAAHQLIHSRQARDRALGLMLLATAFYMHFRIAHVHGHHRRAATYQDPATARLGESLYAFLPRSIAGQVREAWEFEAARLRRAGRPAIGLRNRMVGYFAVEGALLIVGAIISVRLLGFMVTVALVAVSLLESFNYVAHYGLTRGKAPNGRVEPLKPHHSWNSSRLMNNAALFSMGRHTDHHRRVGRAYDMLQQTSGSADLPSGYAAALLTALIPPLWRRIMDPRAQKAAIARF